MATRNWLPVIAAMTQGEIQGRLITSGPQSGLHRFASDHGWPVLALGDTSRMTMGFRAPRIARFLSDHETDLIHAHEVIPTIVAGIAALLGEHQPIIFHRHHTYSSRRHAFSSRLAARIADVTFAVSEAAAAAAIADDQSDKDDVLVMLNGASPPRSVGQEEVRELRARCGIGEDHPVVVCVGRMRKEKTQYVAIEAAAEAAKVIPDLHLVLVGSGPEEGALQAQGAALRHEVDIHFVGLQDDVTPWFCAGDLVVVPSLREALPLVILEAMAAGRPIVASAVGGIPEVLDDANGLLVEPGNVFSFAAAITDLLSDTARRRSMGSKGQERYAQHFTIDAMVKRWSAGYETVLTRMTSLRKETPPA